MAYDFRVLPGNEKEILLKVYTRKAVSRSQLAKGAGQKKATLYRGVDSLLKEGLLLTMADSVNSGTPGRPSDLLFLNPRVGCSFAVTLWRKSCNVAFLDFNGQLLEQDSFDFSETQTTNSVYHILQSFIRKMLQAHPEMEKKFLGISIASVGLLDHNLECIQRLNNSEYPVLQKLYLPRLIREQYHVPVSLHNIVVCAAIGYHTRCSHIQNMAYILIDSGIGLHVLINGRSLYLKSSYTNGLGHMVVSLDGPRCECGAYGCLETYCSEKAIVQQVRVQLKLGTPGRFSMEQADQLSFRDVCSAAKEGDALCQRVIRDAAAVFLVGLRNFLNLLPMDLLVFGGAVPNHAPGFFEQIKESMNQQGTLCTLELDRNIQENINIGCTHTLLQELLGINKER